VNAASLNTTTTKENTQALHFGDDLTRAWLALAAAHKASITETDEAFPQKCVRETFLG
jgi:hypothetical protein